MASETASREPDQSAIRAARADLYDDAEAGEESVETTEFYAGLLAIERDALDLRQRAVEVAAFNPFAARSELGQMEVRLADLHDDVRSAHDALLTQSYDEFNRTTKSFDDAAQAQMERHQSAIRQRLDRASVEVIRTRDAISDQKVTAMMTSGLLIGVTVLVITVVALIGLVL